jgi:hypothetical protein
MEGGWKKSIGATEMRSQIRILEKKGGVIDWERIRREK